MKTRPCILSTFDRIIESNGKSLMATDVIANG